jgi:hypothetical protein
MRSMIMSATFCLLALSATAAYAQPAPQGDASFVGATVAKGSCPALRLHILRAGTVLSGVVFYADGSGISSVKGTTNGKTFDWTQTSISGHGPVGNVTGTIGVEGAMAFKWTGTPCTLSASLPMYNNVLNTGG